MTFDAPRYTGTAMALHWAAALLIVVAFVVGLWMVPLAISPLKFRAYAYHKWMGVTVFLIVLAQLAWRARHPAPPPVAMPEWQRAMSDTVHVLLWILMIASPLSGYVYSSAAGVQTVWLGIVPLPDLVGKDRDLASVLKAVHVLSNYVLAALVILHAAAAVKHHVVDRDGLLGRMLPMSRGGS
jgi:cytochrome b561